MCDVFILWRDVPGHDDPKNHYADFETFESTTAQWIDGFDEAHIYEQIEVYAALADHFYPTAGKRERQRPSIT